MRILLVNDYAVPFGGAEIAQDVLREALRRRCHEVRIFAARPWIREGSQSLADYSCFGTMSRFRALVQTLNPWAAVALRRVLVDFQPDVVHVRVFLTQLSPLILPFLRNVPSLHHVTWYRAICPLGTKILPDGSPCRDRAGVACRRNGCLPTREWLPLMVQMRLWRKWASVFRLSVANSEEGWRLLTAEGFHRVEMVWNGVNAVASRPLLPATPTVLFAGRLVHQKGADVLLRAAERVVKQIPNARFLIAGDGPERAALTKLAKELKLNGSVSFLGHLSRSALEQHASRAWVQVVPSRWAESFANVAAEAMMRGTAVIASATGGMAEYIRDGETGMLVRPSDEAALEDALLSILWDPELAERMGRRGREVALLELTADACAERFESLYKGLIDYQHEQSKEHRSAWIGTRQPNPECKPSGAFLSEWRNLWKKS
jgi:glycosyltransferase involved in cell wall biosynthesis